MPVYFLGHLGGSEISIYTISVRCISLLAFVSLSIDSYLLPRLAKLYGKREHREINILMKKVINASMGFSVFLGFIYILMGPMVVTFWAGDAYESSYYVALPILFMYLLSFIFGPYQSYLLMSGGERDVNWANAMAFVIVFVICFFLQENKILSAGWASFAIMVGRGISIVYVWYRGRRLMDERLLID
jgi:O-antigen/teichoic acid export membrane protein